jgi:hypothetical protein
MFSFFLPSFLLFTFWPVSVLSVYFADTTQRSFQNNCAPLHTIFATSRPGLNPQAAGHKYDANVQCSSNIASYSFCEEVHLLTSEAVVVFRKNIIRCMRTQFLLQTILNKLVFVQQLCFQASMSERTGLDSFKNEFSWTLKERLFLKIASLCQFSNFLTKPPFVKKTQNFYHRFRGSLSPRHGASSGCGWRNGLHIWRVAANILNKQLRTADKGWSSSLGVGLGANNVTMVQLGQSVLFDRLVWRRWFPRNALW